MTFEEDIKSALDTLKSGGVIVYPTDTIWGLGCDATNPDAVSKLYELKGRAEAKASLSLVDSIATLDRYVKEIPEAAEMLLEVATDPLTIIYDHPQGIAPALMADDGSAAFRITSEKFSNELCRRLRRPIVSTSANMAGQPAPKDFNEIDAALLDKADYVVEYNRGISASGLPSEIIKVADDNSVKIIRGRK